MLNNFRFVRSRISLNNSNIVHNTNKKKRQIPNPTHTNATFVTLKQNVKQFSIPNTLHMLAVHYGISIGIRR